MLRSNIKKALFGQYTIIYVIVISVFVMGVLLGASSVNLLPSEQTGEISGYLAKCFEYLSQNQTEWALLLKNSALENMRWVLALYLLGLTVFGVPVIIAANGVRGYALGFSIGFLIKNYYAKGVLVTLAAILPQSFILLPAFTVLSVFCVRHAIKRNIYKENRQAKKELLFSYTIWTIIFSGAILAGSLVEACVTPVLLKSFMPILP